MAFEHGFDCQFNGNTVVEENAGDTYNRIREFMGKTLHSAAPIYDHQWTASGAEGNLVYVLRFQYQQPVGFITVDKNAVETEQNRTIYFRPMIAF